MRSPHGIVVVAMLFALLPGRAPADPSELSAPYPAALERGIAALENAAYAPAREALLLALRQDRNETIGQLALGTIYLHTGDGTRAGEAFEKVLRQRPSDALATLGAALAHLQRGKIAAARPLIARLPSDDVPSAPLLARYVRLLDGDAAAVASQTARVGPDEPDALVLELAAFAALRGGDTARGERLLAALLARDDGRPLTEMGAVILNFERSQPAEGGAPGLAQALFLPAPTGEVLTGQVTLEPGALPVGTAMVSYDAPGSSLHAATNAPPYTIEWDTTRNPSGVYTVRVQAYTTRGDLLGKATRTVRVQNATVSGAERLSPSLQQALRARLLGLLTPRLCRKAAHFALAERAILRGESAVARERIESVVAIDPEFRGAYQSLKRFHKTYTDNAGALWRGGTREKLVALTFDDGPHPTRTPPLLEALRTLRVPSTFFVVGKRAEESPELLRQMIRDGHEIGNHSYSHPNLTYLTPVAVQRELCRTSVIVRDATGRRPVFYRPPGGNFNGATADAAASLGMAGGYWTVDAYKFENAPFTPTALARFVLQKVRPGAILLMHNAPDNTIAALPEIVAGLRAQGYTPVTMSELLRRTRSTPSSAAPRLR
jgi:peptidoglycan/xylan/chitin deacetylase (PgdA/CDA1 family)/Flp pilus assembly protein TadD